MRALSAVLTAFAVAVTGLAFALSRGDGGDTTRLEQEIAAGSQAQETLRSELRGLQRSLRTLRTRQENGLEAATTQMGERIDRLQRQLAETVVTRLDELEGQVGGLATEIEAGVGGVGEVEGAIAELRESVGALNDDVNGVSGDLAALRDDHELLSSQFDNHIEEGN